MNLCIDLCCGLKGFSKAFLESDWEVVTIDIDSKFNPTICKDVRELKYWEIEMATKYQLTDYDVIVVLASPPCERFSIANRMFPKTGIRQALEIVGAVFEIIALIRPAYWVVENPKGRLRWFLGKPNSSIKLSDYGSKYRKPTDLWHNLTFHIIEAEKPYEPSWSSAKNHGKGSTGLLRLRDPSKRAEMPFGLSKTILDIVSMENKDK